MSRPNGNVFFAGLSETAGTIATFGLFAVAFLIRPLGGCSSVRLPIGSGATGCWPRRWC
jgi:hypothetical protein